MAFSEIAYRALQDVVGAENVSDDEVVCQGYSRVNWRSSAFLQRQRLGTAMRPACVVLPGCTEEVQAVIRIANRYKFPFVPMGSGYIEWALPSGAGYVVIDPKRMDKIIKLDGRNMYAVIEPYVTFADLQTEAMKKGLSCPSPLAGAQVSVLANYAWHGAYGNSWISGSGAQNLLAYEIVLPDGEIMRTGAPSLDEDEWFWNDGPGPDLRGLLRQGNAGHAGGLGMVTRISCRLYPWAGPAVLPTDGVSIEKVSPLPPDRFRWYMVRFPFTYPEEEEKELRQSAELFYEMGKAEIAVVATHLAQQFLYTYSSKTKQDLFDNMERDVFPCGFCVIGLQATTSVEQLNYEEKVLKDMVAKVGGQFVGEEEEPYKVWIERAANEWLRHGHGIRLARPSDSFTIGAGCSDSIDGIVEEILRTNSGARQLLASEKQLGKDFVQPLSIHGGWISPKEFGYWCLMTTDLFPEQSVKQASETMEIMTSHLKGAVALKSGSPAGSLLGPAFDLLGPLLDNAHLLIKKIKRTFDPNNVSNPPFATTPDVLSEEEMAKMAKMMEGE
jgi:glycolate oxidase